MASVSASRLVTARPGLGGLAGSRTLPSASTLSTPLMGARSIGAAAASTHWAILSREGAGEIVPSAAAVSIQEARVGASAVVTAPSASREISASSSPLASAAARAASSSVTSGRTSASGREAP